MVTIRRLRTYSIFLYITLITVGCGTITQSGTRENQTPVYVVVTDTPQPRVVETSSGDLQTIPPERLDSEFVTIPAPFLCKAEVVEQTYESGFMFWVGGSISERCQLDHTFVTGSGEIWVAIMDRSGTMGEWLIFVDNWNEDLDPELDIDLIPPSDDRQQPVRGFGKVWRLGLTTVQRNSLGWATGDELKFITDYRYDQGGFLNSESEFVPRPGLHRLFALGGEQIFFDEVSGTVFYISPEN